MYVLLKNRCFFDSYLLSFLWIAILGFVSTVNSAGGISDHMAKLKAIKDQVLKDYDKMVRPTLGESNTTEVKTDFIPRQIIHFDEESCLLSMDFVIWMMWVDPRLKWNATDYKGVLQIPVKYLWVPDLTVHNSHSTAVDPTQEVLVVVESSGHVYWVPPVLTETTCSPDPSAYPRDETTCLIEFGSWTHDGWEIDFQQGDHLYMSQFNNIHPRWEVLVKKAGLRKNVEVYDCCPEPYISLEITLPLKRRPLPEIEATRVPCILIMVLTLSIFLLPPDSSKKLLLGGTLFLSLCVLLVYIAWSTRYFLAIMNAVSFVQSTMYIVVTTLLLQVLVITKLCSLDGPTRPPPAIMEMLNGELGKWTCLRLPLSDKNLPLDRVQLREDCAAQDNSPSIREEWMLFAGFLDRIFFLIMTLVTVLIHHL